MKETSSKVIAIANLPHKKEWRDLSKIPSDVRQFLDNLSSIIADEVANEIEKRANKGQHKT